MDRWPHQMHAVDDFEVAVRNGHRRIVLSAPTGMGKSVIMSDIIVTLARQGWYAVVYTNRRMLLDQLSDTLDRHRIAHGIRAAGSADERDKPVQISSLPTERARTLTDDEFGAWEIHGHGRRCVAIIDEAHVNTGETAREIIKRHVEAGHVVLGVTATPIGLGGLYDHLILAGTITEGRKCGALVYAQHYGCDEPDTQQLKRKKAQPVGEDLSEPELRKLYPMNKRVVGNVIDWYRRINPDGRPTVLFACGVKESLWFSQEFTKAGIPAAHICGDWVWFPTEADTADGFERSGRGSRQKLMDMSRSGEVKVICNRFILREGIDAPWLTHGIFATIFGSLQTYLQAGGRLLRSGGKSDDVTIQDHGGNWWRHGSLNADRDWHLSDTPASISGGREERIKSRICRRCFTRCKTPFCPQCKCPVDGEPTTCPKCRRVVTGRKCTNPGCGYELPPGFKSRVVVQLDGTLRDLRGDIFKPDRVCARPDARKDWVAMYHKALRGKGRITFAQARAIYAREHDWGWPATDWPYMPKDPADLYRRVCDVPKEDLIHSGQGVASHG